MQGVGETILWLQVLNVFLSYPITASSYIIDDDKRCLSCLQAMYFVISLVIESILHCLFRLLTKFVAHSSYCSGSWFITWINYRTTKANQQPKILTTGHASKDKTSNINVLLHTHFLLTTMQNLYTTIKTPIVDIMENLPIRLLLDVLKNEK